MTRMLSRSLIISMAAAATIAALLFLTPQISLPARVTQQATSATTSTPGPLPKSEKFILHKFEQSIGEETFTESDATSGTSPATRSFDINFHFVDRGTAVELAASLKTGDDLTPQSFTITGNSSRSSRIDEAVEVQPDQIRSRIDQKWTNSPRPAQFFSIAGYAPATMQLLLVRYWAQHGSPEKLITFPSGTVQIQRQGQDAINIAGHEETLDRYTIRGLIWGLETLWFTPQLDLVAIVTVDAELDHFEVIRDGYEAALPTFVGRAGKNGIATMAQFVSNAPTTNAGTLAIVGATLIDGTGNPPLPNSAVVIHNGKIVAAGSRSSTTIPSNAEVIDSTGKFVLPGLWDMHAHFEQVEWGLSILPPA